MNKEDMKEMINMMDNIICDLEKNVYQCEQVLNNSIKSLSRARLILIDIETIAEVENV
jgi:hypothetical protein